MAILIGLASIGGLSLFLARLTKRSASLMPLVAVALCSVFGTVMGCLGLLRAGAVVWALGCAAALGWVVFKERAGTLRLFTPGLLLFLGLGVFFTVLYVATQPRLTAWDEFTFWGTAAKAVRENHELYTTAQSNVIYTSYPPGLIIFYYFMDFWAPGFTEPALVTSFTFVYLAAFAAGTALLDKRRSLAAVLFAALFCLPFFFEVLPAGGGISWAWLTCYADPALAALFGGALCLWFCDEKKDLWLFLMMSLVLMALTNVKDMGLALALVVVAVAAMDMLAGGLDGITFWRLRRWPAWLCGAGLMALMVVAIYAIWLWHLAGLPKSIDRLDLGSGGESLTTVQMLLSGVMMLFGVGRTEQFTEVSRMMWRALLAEPVSLIGPGVRVFAVILVVLLCAWLLGRTKRIRRRILVFFATSCFFFVVFYIFNIFTYSLIFSWVEASVLKDYDRYIGPYWQGWLAVSLVVLSATVVQQGAKNAAAWRNSLARLTVVGVSAALILVSGARTNWQANFLKVSPSLYAEREAVDRKMAEATAQGMEPEHTVYIVDQYDDGTRFYMFGFEMEATRVQLYGGTDEEGEPVRGSSTAHLIPPGEPEGGHSIAADPSLLSAYLEKEGCDHLLISELDGTFMEIFGGMFEDGLAGYEPGDGYYITGPRYYAIEYDAGGMASFHAIAEGGGV